MRFGKSQINPIKLWSRYCDVKEGEGPFLPLTFCPNPKHDNTRSPAFQINIFKPYVHCFASCGISGNYEHAICLIEGIYDKREITEEDLERAKLPYDRGELPQVRKSRLKVRQAHREARQLILKSALGGGGKNDARARFSGRSATSSAEREDGEGFEEELAHKSFLPKEALAYLRERDINKETIARWRIGFDEKQDRLLIPAFDSRGRIMFLIRRAISNRSLSYLYPGGSAKTSCLFGVCNVDKAMIRSEGLIVVEGPLDCIRLHQEGFKNTVAVLGAYISKKQLAQMASLRPHTVYLFFDKDASGVWSVDRLSELFKKYRVKVPLYPKGDKLDPAQLTQKQIKKAIENAVPVRVIKNRIKEANQKDISKMVVV